MVDSRKIFDVVKERQADLISNYLGCESLRGTCVNIKAYQVKGFLNGDPTMLTIKQAEVIIACRRIMNMILNVDGYEFSPALYARINEYLCLHLGKRSSIRGLEDDNYLGEVAPRFPSDNELTRVYSKHNNPGCDDIINNIAVSIIKTMECVPFTYYSLLTACYGATYVLMRLGLGYFDMSPYDAKKVVDLLRCNDIMTASSVIKGCCFPVVD